MHFEFGQLPDHDIPNDGVVHIVISVDETVAKSNDLGTHADFVKQVRKPISQTPTGFPDDFELSFDGGFGFFVVPIHLIIHPQSEIPDGNQRLLYIHQQFQSFRRHKGVGWFVRQSRGKWDFSCPAW